MNLRQSAIDRTERFESLCSHFYLDTLGNVTVGYGRLVADADAATALPLTKADGSAASDDDKRAEWTNIHGQEAGHPASYYKKYATLFLSDADATALLVSDLNASIGYLSQKFAGLDAFPDDAQDALLDMIFNIGPGNFSATKWPSLFAAVNATDWITAAAQSNRPAVSADRNAAIKQLFLNAAATTRAARHAAVLTAYNFESLSAAFRQHIADTLNFAKSTESVPRLFPNGITHIEIDLKAGPVELSVKLNGPDEGKKPVRSARIKR
jgi:GH24 family phage-related lysozyme (muramidase)